MKILYNRLNDLVLPCDDNKCIMILGSLKLGLQSSLVGDADARIDRQTKSNGSRLGRSQRPHVVKGFAFVLLLDGGVGCKDENR
jgi:hypothetical protein